MIDNVFGDHRWLGPVFVVKSLQGLPLEEPSFFSPSFFLCANRIDFIKNHSGMQHPTNGALGYLRNNYGRKLCVVKLGKLHFFFKVLFIPLNIWLCFLNQPDLPIALLNAQTEQLFAQSWSAINVLLTLHV